LQTYRDWQFFSIYGCFVRESFQNQSLNANIFIFVSNEMIAMDRNISIIDLAISLDIYRNFALSEILFLFTHLHFTKFFS